MAASGGSSVQVTFDIGSERFPQFSPDGRCIAYVSNVSVAFAINARPARQTAGPTSS